MIKGAVTIKTNVADPTGCFCYPALADIQHLKERFGYGINFLAVIKKSIQQRTSPAFGNIKTQINFPFKILKKLVVFVVFVDFDCFRRRPFMVAYLCI
jgi:hypothetical protein